MRAYAETCPHYLALDATRIRPAGSARRRLRHHLAAAADAARLRCLWDGLVAGDLDLVATRPRPGPSLGREGRRPATGIPFDRISNGAPGIETLLSVVHTRGVATGRITIERMVDLIATTPARLFGFERKGAVEPGRDADLVVFDPAARRTVRAADLHHTSDYTPYEGLDAVGAVRSVFVRGRAVIRDGAFVGRRGFGRFVERGHAGDG